MIRTELLTQLSRLLAVLPQNPLVPALGNIYFDGEWAAAYNSMLAIKVPCDLPLKGGILGRQLIALLSSSKANEVVCSLIDNDSGVAFGLGRTKAQFALLPLESFTFVEPSKKGVTLQLDAALRAGLGIALSSTTTSPLDDSRYGITLAFEEDELSLFSTDEVTVARVRLPHGTSGLSGKAFILLEGFCRLALKLKNPKLTFTTEGDVLATSTDGILFGKVHLRAVPKQFESVFAGIRVTQKAPVPKALKSCLERAVGVGAELTTFNYSGGKLQLLTRGQGWEVEDTVKIDLGEKPISIQTRAEYLLRCLDAVEWLELNSRCVSLGSDNVHILVSVSDVGGVS